MALRSSVILTGASDGIGKALAFEFASRGFALGLVARRIELLEEVAAECKKLGSPEVIIEACDVSDEAKFEQVLFKLDDALLGTDIFIANAGIGGKSLFNEDAWKDVRKTLSVNVMAAIHGLETLKPRMVARKRGTLCGVSSFAGSRGLPTAGAYSTSKAALTTHLETLRVDLIPYGISVVTVAPGYIETAMTQKNTQAMPFMITAEKAAKIFVKGILAKKRFIVAPRPYGFLYPVIQMLPRSLFDFVFHRATANLRKP